MAGVLVTLSIPDGGMFGLVLGVWALEEDPFTWGCF